MQNHIVPVDIVVHGVMSTTVAMVTPYGFARICGVGTLIMATFALSNPTVMQSVAVNFLRR